MTRRATCSATGRDMWLNGFGPVGAAIGSH